MIFHDTEPYFHIIHSCVATWQWRGLAHFVSSPESLLLSSPSLHIASQSFDPICTGQPAGDTPNVGLHSSWRVYTIKCQLQIFLPHRGVEFPSCLRWLLLWLWQLSGKNPVDAGSYSSTGRQKGRNAKSKRLRSIYTSAWQNPMGYSCR